MMNARYSLEVSRMQRASRSFLTNEAFLLPKRSQDTSRRTKTPVRTLTTGWRHRRAANETFIACVTLNDRMGAKKSFCRRMQLQNERPKSTQCFYTAMPFHWHHFLASAYRKKALTLFDREIGAFPRTEYLKTREKTLTLLGAIDAFALEQSA